jgi:hypothetical protein
MNSLTDDQDGDSENTPIFPGEEDWLGFQDRAKTSCCLCEEHRRVGGSSPNKDNNSPSPFCVIETMPASRLQTVFAITHPDQSLKPCGFNAIMEIEMVSSIPSSLTMELCFGISYC